MARAAAAACAPGPVQLRAHRCVPPSVSLLTDSSAAPAALMNLRGLCIQMPVAMCVLCAQCHWLCGHRAQRRAAHEVVDDQVTKWLSLARLQFPPLNACALKAGWLAGWLWAGSASPMQLHRAGRRAVPQLLQGGAGWLQLAATTGLISQAGRQAGRHCQATVPLHRAIRAIQHTCMDGWRVAAAQLCCALYCAYCLRWVTMPCL